MSTEIRLRTTVTSWLLFDRYPVLPDASDGAVKEIFVAENVVDVQFAESLGNLVRGEAGSAEVSASAG